jgi:hypothetical protein
MDYLSEEGLSTYDTQIKGYVNAQMAQRSDIPASQMAVINDIDTNVETILSNYVTKTDLQNALANVGGGEVITINMINYNEGCHVEVTSGTTVIDNNVANGDTVTVPFGVEYTITAHDGVTIVEGSQITSVAAKMSSNHTIDCGIVDLGLPSGNLWASKNVGAANPYDAGLYFTWGNVNGYVAGSGHSFDSYGYGAPGRYLAASFTSGNPTYDAARANMGGDWRMPTRTECQELIDNCTWTWGSVNGVNGYTVTGQNGNSIFLPASGYYNGTTLSDSGTYGDYWSTDFYGSSSAYCLYFYSGSKGVSGNNRYYGQSIRAVRTPQS